MATLAAVTIALSGLAGVASASEVLGEDPPVEVGAEDDSGAQSGDPGSGSEFEDEGQPVRDADDPEGLPAGGSLSVERLSRSARGSGALVGPVSAADSGVAGAVGTAYMWNGIWLGPFLGSDGNLEWCRDLLQPAPIGEGTFVGWNPTPSGPASAKNDFTAAQMGWVFKNYGQSSEAVRVWFLCDVVRVWFLLFVRG